MDEALTADEQRALKHMAEHGVWRVPVRFDAADPVCSGLVNKGLARPRLDSREYVTRTSFPIMYEPTSRGYWLGCGNPAQSS